MKFCNFLKFQNLNFESLQVQEAVYYSKPWMTEESSKITLGQRKAVRMLGQTE